MPALSVSRKDSSNAFLIHWRVTQPPACFSATRMRPASSSAMTCATASRTSAGAAEGVSAARFSHAASMTAAGVLMYRGAKLELYRGGLFRPGSSHALEARGERARDGELLGTVLEMNE